VGVLYRYRVVVGFTATCAIIA